VWGIASQVEVSTLRDDLLSPPEEKVVKGHLVSLTPQGPSNDMTFTVRMLDGTTLHRPIPDGSFVINCTDNIGESANEHDPIVSDDGLVLTPQGICGFPGQSAHLCTHAWYLKPVEFDRLWRTIPRFVFFEYTSKINFGFILCYGLVVATRQLCDMLPKELVAASHQVDMARGGGGRFRAILNKIIDKWALMYPERYTDKEKWKPPPTEGILYGGNLPVVQAVAKL